MSPSVLGQTRRRPALWGVPLLLCAFLAGSLLESSPSPRVQHSAPATPSVVSVVDLGLAAGETSGTFRVASFNVLGANHTGGRGTHAAMASGATRTGYLVRLLDLRGLDVAGLQEFQRVAVRQVHGPDQGRLVGVPGQPAEQLRDAQLDRLAYVGVGAARGQDPADPVLQRHDGADAVRPAAQRREPDGSCGSPTSTTRRRGSAAGTRRSGARRARRSEIALANRLWESGVPLILTGDMNEQSIVLLQDDDAGADASRQRRLVRHLDLQAARRSGASTGCSARTTSSSPTTRRTAVPSSRRRRTTRWSSRT